MATQFEKRLKLLEDVMGKLLEQVEKIDQRQQKDSIILDEFKEVLRTWLDDGAEEE